MNTYKCSFELRGAWGGYDEREYIVVAETRAVALGLCLEHNMDTTAGQWEITPLGPGIHFISSRSN